MAIWLKQSTAVTIKFGPFVDDGDGVTAMTALTISQADIRLSKNGGNIAQTNNSAGATHDELGYYDIPLDSTDTNTLGTLRVAVSESGALPVWQDFMVVPANVWDSFFGADLLDVSVTQLAGSAISQASGLINANITQISGDSAAADNLEAAADGTGYNLGGGSVVAASVTGAVGSVTGNVGGNVTGSVGSIAAGGLTASSIAADAFTAAKFAADVTTEFQNGLATAAALSTVEGKIDTIDTNVDSILADTGTDGVVVAAGSKTGYELSSGGVDAILDEVIEGSYTVRQYMRLFAAALAGKISGAATTTVVIRDTGDSKDRITATVDADGNRSAVTLDAT